MSRLKSASRLKIRVFDYKMFLTYEIAKLIVLRIVYNIYGCVTTIDYVIQCVSILNMV